MHEQSPYTLIGNNDGLVGRVVRQLRGLITDGQLLPGTILPPQRELAAQLGVSLPVIREAIRHLQAEGFLETKRGVGTTVRKVSREQIARTLDIVMQADGKQIGFEELHLVRTILETEIAGIAAGRATRESTEHLKQIIIETELAVGNPTQVAELDVAFHETITQMTGNHLLAALMRSIMELSGEYFRVVNVHLDPRKDICPFHHKIMEQISLGSAQGARAAMKEHLEQAKRNHEKVMKELLDTKSDTAQEVAAPEVSNPSHSNGKAHRIAAHS